MRKFYTGLDAGFAEVRIFFEDDFDTAGDRDGDDGAGEAEHIHADDDGGEDEGGREVQGIALEFRGDEVVFDLFVDDVENEENDGGDRGAEEEEQGNEDATDDRTKHGDKVKDHGDEAHREGEAAREATGQGKE